MRVSRPLQRRRTVDRSIQSRFDTAMAGATTQSIKPMIGLNANPMPRPRKNTTTATTNSSVELGRRLIPGSCGVTTIRPSWAARRTSPFSGDWLRLR